MRNLKLHLFSIIFSPFSLVPLGIVFFIGDLVLSNSTSFEDIAVLFWIIGAGICISDLVLFIFGLPVAMGLHRIDAFKYHFIAPLSVIPTSIVGVTLQNDHPLFVSLLYASGLTVAVSYKKIFDILNSKKK